MAYQTNLYRLKKEVFIMIFVIKKDGTHEQFDVNKIRSAVSKSAFRALVKFDDSELDKICDIVKTTIDERKLTEVPIFMMHNIVENALDQVNPIVAKSYKDYRNYKQDFVGMLDKVYRKSQAIMYIGDKENSNTDSTLVSTKRSLIYNQLNKELYQKFFMTTEELQACKDGYIYIHDMSARRDTMNCCLFDVGSVLKGGFEMGNVWYNEPKTLDTAFDVIGDIVLSAASQQYGGFTIPEIDKLLAPYAEKSYELYVNKYMSLGLPESVSRSQAMRDVKRDFAQGFQGWEYKFNTVGSSRGDYPFITVTTGLDTSKFGKIASITLFDVHKYGQGKSGYEKPVLFPKIVFLYDENLHGKGKPLEDVYEAGIECSSKTMYPDWLSLTGDGYVASIYKKYKKVISPMGCVDGKEVITYIYNDEVHVSTFEDMWLDMVIKLGTNRVINQSTGKILSDNDTDCRYLYIDTLKDNLKIYDTRNGYVKVKKLIRNTNHIEYDIKLSNGKILKCTDDHPLPVIGVGRVQAKHCKIGDTLITQDMRNHNMCMYSNTDSNNVNTITIDNEYYAKGFMFNSLHIVDDTTATITMPALSLLSINIDSETYGLIEYNHLSELAESTYLVYNNVAKTNKITFVGKVVVDYLRNKYGDVLNGRLSSICEQGLKIHKTPILSFIGGLVDSSIDINLSYNYSLSCYNMYINLTDGKYDRSTVEYLSYICRLAKAGYYITYNGNMYINISGTIIPYCVRSSNDHRFKFSTVMSDTGRASVLSRMKIDSIDIIDREDDWLTYDVETESDMFEVSGICSHNCRAFLSPWFERGGMTPDDESDQPVFVGRFNIGAVSLHLPMIYAKSKKENKNFYDVLDYYLELIRKIHLRTYDYIGEFKASINPLAYCEGGFYGGHLGIHDKIKPILKSATASFGITALNELQRLHNGKSLVEDNAFTLEVMKHINDKISEFKEEDGRLYAIYGTPAESLCGLQVEQFRKKYGIVEGVSDREYVSNSFHCHVTENISPIQKQDIERAFWDYFNGGKIQFAKYPLDYNLDAIRMLITRAMKYGFYEGVNLSLSYCNHCGHQELNMDVCPKCGSSDLTKIDRMNGYLSYSRVKGDTRLNSAKMAEIRDRKSM